MLTLLLDENHSYSYKYIVMLNMINSSEVFSISNYKCFNNQNSKQENVSIDFKIKKYFQCLDFFYYLLLDF